MKKSRRTFDAIYFHLERQKDFEQSSLLMNNYFINWQLESSFNTTTSWYKTCILSKMFFFFFSIQPDFSFFDSQHTSWWDLKDSCRVAIKRSTFKLHINWITWLSLMYLYPFDIKIFWDVFRSCSDSMDEVIIDYIWDSQSVWWMIVKLASWWSFDNDTRQELEILTNDFVSHIVWFSKVKSSKYYIDKSVIVTNMFAIFFSLFSNLKILAVVDYERIE